MKRWKARERKDTRNKELGEREKNVEIKRRKKIRKLKENNAKTQTLSPRRWIA